MRLAAAFSRADGVGSSEGAVFADFGNAWFGTFEAAKLKLGVGAEVRMELYLYYYFGASLQLGYARGVMEGGENQLYFLLNNPF